MLLNSEKLQMLSETKKNHSLTVNIELTELKFETIKEKNKYIKVF